MVAQVLTERSFSVFEERILNKLAGYCKPVKTKHLADRLNVDRIDLISVLNELRKGGLIHYTSIINRADDRRGREDKYYGWAIIR